MPALAELLPPAVVAELSRRHTTSSATAEPDQFRVSRLRDRVVVVRAAGGLVPGTDAESARRLARQLGAAAGQTARRA